MKISLNQMTQLIRIIGAAVMLMIQMSAAAKAQEEDPTATTPPRSAEAVFELYCAPCHGEDGRGNGPLAFGLSMSPPDLTTLTIRNHGNFPRERLARLIDGRDDIKAHTEEREMPVGASGSGLKEKKGGADQ
jgi:mono/diheme cytochrome c family protein